MEKEKRVSKEEYYLSIAKEVAARSTCLRRRFGAVIVRNDAIVSTGYNGPGRGLPNCNEYGCLKDKYKAEEGKDYEKCRAGPLHAEVNSILNAARHGNSVLNATMYIAGFRVKSREITEAKPCKGCQKEIINAGLEKVIIKTREGFKESRIEDWVREAFETEDKDIKGFY